MEENMQCFQRIWFSISRKVKMQLKCKKKKDLCSGWRRCYDRLKCQKQFMKFLVLLTFWPNSSLLWGCLMHWKVLSSTLASTHWKPIEGESKHTQNI